MSLDVSEAIALAKDLLQTSSEFQAHDPDLAADFAGRAFEICDDLGIDRTLIGDSLVDAAEQEPENDVETASMPVTPARVEATPDDLEEDARQTSDQLNALLRQQARVLQNARSAETEVERPKSNKRSFWRFGRSDDQPVTALQSA